MGLLYTFIVIVCAAGHPHCQEKTAARVMRSAPMGQFGCDKKLAIFNSRAAGTPRGRYRARCDSREAGDV